MLSDSDKAWGTAVAMPPARQSVLSAGFYGSGHKEKDIKNASKRYH
jgi:hypothetical protein